LYVNPFFIEKPVFYTPCTLFPELRGEILSRRYVQPTARVHRPSPNAIDIRFRLASGYSVHMFWGFLSCQGLSPRTLNREGLRKSCQEFGCGHDPYPAIEDILLSLKVDLLEIGNVESLSKIAESRTGTKFGFVALRRKPGPFAAILRLFCRPDYF